MEGLTGSRVQGREFSVHLHVLQPPAEELLAVAVELDEGELAVDAQRGIDGAHQGLHRIAHEILALLDVRVAELARARLLRVRTGGGRVAAHQLAHA